ncbi:MAG: iron-sulfur cluster assembly accessory protein [Chloroflexi bacterium]|nr:MAG: iron-sulfur cluster assembly accessory protein [Chloroflexota bacterium]
MTTTADHSTDTATSTEESSAVALVAITPRAAARAKEMLTQKGMPDGSLRVFIAGGGCSGYQYGMALAREADAEDTVIETEGVRIVIDADSARLIGGAEVDYVEDLMKSGFTIYNPNATSSCACGSSFQADGGTPRACH